jgi:hypothetical protein
LCVASFKTTMTNTMLVIMGFFLCATCKTMTTSAAHRPSFICVLQALKLRRQALSQPHFDQV